MGRRHHQDIRRRGQAAKRIERHGIARKRHIGRHLAIILKIDIALVQNGHGIAHVFGALAAGIAKGGIGQEGHARLIAKAPGNARGFLRDVGQFLSGRQFVDRGIGYEHSPPADEGHRHADGAVPRAVVDGVAHVVEGHGKIPREAGDERIGITTTVTYQDGTKVDRTIDLRIFDLTTYRVPEGRGRRPVWSGRR